MADTIVVNKNDFIPGSNYWKWKDVLKDNSPNLPVANYTNLVDLTINVLDPLAAKFPGQILINSCYRTNVPTGGSSTSDHLKGRAVDLDSSNNGINRDIYLFVKEELSNSATSQGKKAYDQLIWETTTQPEYSNSGSPPPDGQPGWVHVGYRGNQNRGQVLYFKNHKNGGSVSDVSSTATGEGGKPGNDMSKTQTTTGDQEDVSPQLSYAKTFEQIQTNIANLELEETSVTWGKKSLSGETSDWISLKQFILYLATRHSPESLYPFIELIPDVTINTEKKSERHGETPQDVLVSSGAVTKAQVLKLASKIMAMTKDKLSKQGLVDSAGKPTAAGVDYLDAVSKDALAFNSKSGVADLFSLDPFEEGIKPGGELSEGGKEIFEKKKIGVRAYGQVVLNPTASDNTSSKPGPIGFTSLEVKAGAQCENGLALITMQLQDIQGNKFTDITSPWSFIYDARPTSVGGDYWFRFGWQVKLPVYDIRNSYSLKFWNHPGWDLWGPEVRNFIISQIKPSRPYITLTQAINASLSDEPKLSSEKDLNLYAMFDEGIEFNAEQGTVVANRYSLNLKNYLKLSILNPEIAVDDNGVITASLSFRTTGAIALNLPLYYCKFLRQLLKKTTQLTLGDLIVAVTSDIEASSYLNVTSNDEKQKKLESIKTSARNLAKTRDFNNLVYIIGLEKGGMTGEVHPDQILLDIDSDYVKEIINPDPSNEKTLIGWVRNVLEDNNCTLQSAATGSGAGINSAWVVTCSEDFETEKLRQIPKSKLNNIEDINTTYTNALSLMQTEKDVFSYRFQGSLVETLGIEKTDNPNAMKIEMDNAIGDFPSTETTSLDLIHKPTTMFDRSRNLKILFSQMQNCEVTCLAHPWLGPGKRVFVKGMGFFDGEYLVLEVTHKLDNNLKFISTLKGARMIVPSDEEETVEVKSESVKNGKGNFSKKVDAQYKENLKNKVKP